MTDMRISEHETPHRSANVVPYNVLADPAHLGETVSLLVAGLEILAIKGGYSPNEFVEAAKKRAAESSANSYRARFAEWEEEKRRAIWDFEHAPKIIADLIVKECLIVPETGGVLKADKIVCPVCAKKVNWEDFGAGISGGTSLGDDDTLRAHYRTQLLQANRNYGGVHCIDEECPGRFPGGIGTIRFVSRV